MTKIYTNSSIPLFDLLGIYIQNNEEAIEGFIQRKITKVLDPPGKPLYSEIINNFRRQQFVNQIPTTPEQFMKSAQKLNIDKFYYSTFINSLSKSNEAEASALISYQLQQLKSGLSHYHWIQKVIQARTNCIKKLKSTIEDLRQSIARISELDAICILMIHIRFLTLILVENIYDWNSSIQSITQHNLNEIKYIHKGCSILDGICKDTEFLKTTLLKKYLKFPKGFDPLLIRITKRIKQKKENIVYLAGYQPEDIDRFSLLLQSDPLLIGRLKDAQMVLVNFYSQRSGDFQKQKEVEDTTPLILSSQKETILKQKQNKHMLSSGIQAPDLYFSDISPDKVALPKLNIYKQQKQKSRSPGFIKGGHKSLLFSDIKQSNKQLYRSDEYSSDSSFQKSHLSNNQIKILNKVKILKQQLKTESQNDLKRYIEVIRRSSLESHRRLRIKQKELSSIFKSLPLSSDRIEEKSILRKRKIGPRGQKFKFLKETYCDGIDADLQTSMKIIRKRSPEIKKMRKYDRKECQIEGGLLKQKVTKIPKLSHQCVSFFSSNKN